MMRRIYFPRPSCSLRRTLWVWVAKLVSVALVGMWLVYALELGAANLVLM